MVLNERNSEMVRNGRRSRGPSPSTNGVNTGTHTPESSDDDNSIKRNGKSKTKQSEYEEKIRVGRDYQAICPPLIPDPDRKPETLADRALLVWSPTKEIADKSLEEYITMAKEQYGYNGEQALGMLFWHKHDLPRAISDLSNFTPFPDEWTTEDKVLFEQAFQFHGKSFHRIRQMLPDKTIASLVKYYYSWKKTRHRVSAMDRQEKKAAAKDSGNGSDNGSENGSNEESENEDNKDQDQSSDQQPVQPNSEGVTATATTTNNNATSASNSSQNGSGGSCSTCSVSCTALNTTPNGVVCNSCYQHWRRTGNKRPTSGPYFGKRGRDRNVDRHKRKPPRGMHINHDDIVTLASSNNNPDELLAQIEREIVSNLSQVQINKQLIEMKNVENSDDLRPAEANNRINARWTNEETMLAVNGVKQFGKDFQAIADILGTKTKAHVQTFYVNYRRRYNLDQLVKEYEARIAAEKADSVTDDVKDEKKEKEEKVTAPAAPTTTESSSTEEKASESQSTPTETGKPVKPENSSSISSKKDVVMEVELDNDEEDDGEPPAKKAAATVPSTTKSQEESAVAATAT
ncbi:RCOR3 family protein [Megaselia abdita]